VASGNDVTVSTYKRKVNSDFGVLTLDGAGRVTSFKEKPVFDFDVSMGIYGINRSVVDRLRQGMPYGFDNLMVDGIRNGLRLEGVPFSGYWLDIGRPEDYDIANQEFGKLKAEWGL
jgi:NDP-sugar pyrophosphorylase family protein